MNQIERSQQPTREVFQRNFLSPRKPVIITGAMNDWNAISLWTDDYLKTVVGNTQVDISVSQNSFFIGNLENGFAKLRQKMNFIEFINLLQKDKLTDNYYYLQQQSIPTNFPKLFSDIEFPEYFDKKLLIDPTIWIGSAGNISPCITMQWIIYLLKFAVESVSWCLTHNRPLHYILSPLIQKSHT